MAMQQVCRTKSRFSGAVSLFLTALLAVQVATAFLPAAGSTRADAIEMIICSADGAQAVTISQSEESGGHADMEGHCPLCIVAVSDAWATQPDANVAISQYTLRYVLPDAARVPCDACGRPYAIRAPPLTV